MRNFFVILTICIFSGCATKPVTSVNAIPVLQAQILDPGLMEKSDTRTERVLLIRDAGFMGSAVEAVVSINRKPIASLNQKEMVVFYLAPGKYMFSVSAKKSVLREPPGETEIEIIPNGLNNFRLRLIPGDGPRIERSQFLQ